MRAIFFTILLFLCRMFSLEAQTNPAITAWVFNTGETGRHYVSGNSTPITDSYLANVEAVYYNTNYAYVEAAGIPSYIIGPYLDGNPSEATDNQHRYRIPLNPAEKLAPKAATSGGVLGTFINGVPIYDWRDDQSYNNQGVWNRDAVVNEMDGFDCIKGHPSPIFSGGVLTGGTYHHHQNPSAFNLDLVELSTVCNTYPADGLYVIDPSAHSPLIGFALDGYPVYGAYGYDNIDGTGGIVRIVSGYELRNITARTHYADGTNVTNGPVVNATYPLGTYKEDYEFTGNGHLDQYNGRFAITPEYPSGTYAYYTTVDANHNSQFPYTIGPDEFFGRVLGTENSNLPANAVLFDPSTLPVELTSFKGEKMSNAVLVEWITDLEINSDFFIVERSSDAINFEGITTVQAQGNTTTTTYYEYEDKEYLDGVSYYRLKQVDIDGSFTYSRIISTEAEKSSIDVNIYPNPSHDFAVIQIRGLSRNNVTIELFDLTGKLLQSTQIMKGSTIGYLDTRTLYSGEYIVRLVNEEEVLNKKIIVLHE